MPGKRLLFSVTKNDFDMQTFSVGGPGGGGKDTSNSGVRLIHRDSGAVGEGRDNRSNTQNRKDAFRRLIETPKFKNWHRIECAKRMGKPVEETPAQILARVDKMIEDGLRSGAILVEESDGVL